MASCCFLPSCRPDGPGLMRRRDFMAQSIFVAAFVQLRAAEALDGAAGDPLGGRVPSRDRESIRGVICDIDSLTQGWPEQTAYPTYLASMVDVPVVNLGRAGYRIDQAIADYTSRAGARFRAGYAAFFLGGTNDINNGADASTLWSRAMTMCGLYRATGYKLFVASITRNNTFDADKEAIRVSHNARLISQYKDFADGYVDFASIPEAIEPSNKAYFVDGQHYTSRLNSILASVAQIASGLPSGIGGNGPELIINGDFDVDLRGWTAGLNGRGPIAAWDAKSVGSVKLPRSDALSYGFVKTEAVTAIGQTYTLTATLINSGANLMIGTGDGESNIKNLSFAAGALSTKFTAISTTTYIRFIPNSGPTYLDEVSMK